MSVRQRHWNNKSGQHSRWVLDYRDKDGERRQETFRLKKDAKAREAQVLQDITAGVHVPRTTSIDVAEAAQNWLKLCEQNGLERGTLQQYWGHVTQHIVPHLGRTKLADLTGPTIAKYERALYEAGLSDSMRRKVVTSLTSILRVAVRQGFTNRNPADGFRVHTDKRAKKKLRVGEDVPSREEIKRFLGVLSPYEWPLFAVAIFAGLRASELRGLRWRNVDLNKQVIHVVERMDKFNTSGPTKSESGQRSIPIGGCLAHTLGSWRGLCPESELGLVFPNSKGNPQALSNIRTRTLIPAMRRAGLVNEEGEVKYSGLHCLRHYHASYLMNPREHGGLGLPLKVVSERLGHSSISLTADVYGHLMPRVDISDALDEGESDLAELLAA